jgi:hypothetical protein
MRRDPGAGPSSDRSVRCMEAEEYDVMSDGPRSAGSIPHSARASGINHIPQAARREIVGLSGKVGHSVSERIDPAKCSQMKRLVGYLKARLGN